MILTIYYDSSETRILSRPTIMIL